MVGVRLVDEEDETLPACLVSGDGKSEVHRDLHKIQSPASFEKSMGSSGVPRQRWGCLVPHDVGLSLRRRRLELGGERTEDEMFDQSYA